MIKKVTKKILRSAGVELSRYDQSSRKHKALYEKYKAFTMTPENIFAMNLELCAHFANVPGDYVECGVWRGGMIAAFSELSGNSRKVHLFDSFEGLPPAKEIDGKEALKWQADTTSPHYYNNCSAEERFAVDAMTMAGSKNYKIYRGWFDQTLQKSEASSIAVLRLDGDWYDSILVCLEHLFDKVTEGGIVILDDYYQWEGCSKAVHDFLSKTRSPSRVFQWKNQVAYIVKKSG
jgi:O-methyltransferase